MVRFILKLLIVVFLMQSAWAAAAQYCQHELGVNTYHFGHHTHQHKNGDPSQVDQASIKADADTSKTGTDSDCPYCHLGAMKSMLPMVVMTPAATEPAPPTTLAYSYPNIVPRQPERPNWRLAA